MAVKVRGTKPGEKCDQCKQTAGTSVVETTTGRQKYVQCTSCRQKEAFALKGPRTY